MNNKPKYDWDGFQVRFVFGFIFGVLTGWKFVRYTTSMKTLAWATIICGVICGFLYGISKPPDFWRRD